MIEEILNGWKNYLISDNKTDNTEAKRRASICASCPFAKRGLHSALLPDYQIKEIKGLYCSSCKCPLSTKVRAEKSECPKNKW